MQRKILMVIEKGSPPELNDIINLIVIKILNLETAPVLQFEIVGRTTAPVDDMLVLTFTAQSTPPVGNV